MYNIMPHICTYMYNICTYIYTHMRVYDHVYVIYGKKYVDIYDIYAIYVSIYVDIYGVYMSHLPYP